MCRMFAYVGSSQKDLESLYAALRKVSNHDSTMWLPDKRHKDGWGCVILSDGKLTHYRTSRPIFEDSFKIPKIKGTTYAIFHTRKARVGTIKIGSPAFSHPFITETDSSTIFLAHNGSLEDPIPKHVVDSEVALREIAKRGGLKEAVGELKGRTQRGLNLCVLTIDRASKKATIEYLNYWNRKKVDKYKQEYYMLYTKRMERGTAVFSSPMKEYFEGEPCKYGKITTLSKRTTRWQR